MASRVAPNHRLWPHDSSRCWPKLSGPRCASLRRLSLGPASFWTLLPVTPAMPHIILRPVQTLHVCQNPALAAARSEVPRILAGDSVELVKILRSLTPSLARPCCGLPGNLGT